MPLDLTIAEILTYFGIPLKGWNTLLLEKRPEDSPTIAGRMSPIASLCPAGAAGWA